MTAPAAKTQAVPCRILTLDGGGAKGFFRLGVLKEVEALIGCLGIPAKLNAHSEGKPNGIPG